MLGVEAGNFLEVLAATVGLAAIIASSASAFTAVKLIGAAYLIWLGIRALREGIGLRTGGRRRVRSAASFGRASRWGR